MSKTSNFVLIALCLIFIFNFLYEIINYSKSTNVVKKQSDKQLIIVGIDGQKYSCNCKRENK